MNILIRFVIAVLFFVLTGCGSSNRAPTEEEILFAVNEDLKEGVACFSLSSDITETRLEFPYVEYAAAKWNRYDALVKAGLIEVSDTKGIPNNNYDKAPREIFAKRFSISGEGDKYYREFSDGFMKQKGFCYAENVIKEIRKISEPVTTMTGTKSVKVTYTYTLKPYSWFDTNKNAISDFSDNSQEIEKKLSATLSGESTLLLTKKGWKHPDYAAPDDLIIDKPSEAASLIGFSSGNNKNDGIGKKLQNFVLGF